MPDLVERAKTIRWLSNIGQSVSLPGKVVRPQLQEWHRFIQASSAADLGIGDEAASAIGGFKWLSEEEFDLHPGPPESVSSTMELRAERLRVSRTVLQGLDEIAEVPWLVIGGIDLRGAVRKSATFAFRMAASEAADGALGFWHQVVDLYEAGVWPAAVDESGVILVV